MLNKGCNLQIFDKRNTIEIVFLFVIIVLFLLLSKAKIHAKTLKSTQMSSNILSKTTTVLSISPSFFISLQKDSYFSSQKYQTLASFIVFSPDRMQYRVHFGIKF